MENTKLNKCNYFCCSRFWLIILIKQFERARAELGQMQNDKKMINGNKNSYLII